ITERYPELAARVLRDGAFGPFVNVFVDGEDARYLDPRAELAGKRTVEILPAMSGGAVAELPDAIRGPHEVYGSFIDEAIDLAARVFVRPGDVAVVESPHFTNAISALRNHGAGVLEVPADDDGLDVAEAERLIRRAGVRPRIFFVVPNFQNPTGATLSLA